MLTDTRKNFLFGLNIIGQEIIKLKRYSFLSLIRNYSHTNKTSFKENRIITSRG